MRGINMNKITKISDNQYELTDELGNTYACKLWLEKKVNEWQIKLPANNSSGRQYIRLKVFNEKNVDGVYEFETKEGESRVLNVSKWKDMLTDIEKARLNVLEGEIEKIKSACIERLKANSQEMKLQREIEKYEREKAKLEAELARLRGLK